MKEKNKPFFRNLLLLFPLCTFLYNQPVFSQTETDSLLYKISLGETYSLYKKEIKENLNLYAGNEYAAPDPFGQKVIGSPFFLSENFLLGSLFYNNILYDSIYMHYQLPGDKVIINDPFNYIHIELSNEKISFFVIANHKFTKISVNAAEALHTTKIYYEELYSGKELIWSIRNKNFTLSPKAEDQTASYVELDQYFLQTGNTYHKIDSEKELLNALGVKKELKKYIREHKLNFKKNFEYAIVNVVQYYDNLKKQ